MAKDPQMLTHMPLAGLSPQQEDSAVNGLIAFHANHRFLEHDLLEAIFVGQFAYILKRMSIPSGVAQQEAFFAQVVRGFRGKNK